jgi:L-fucose isomerase-like protein
MHVDHLEQRELIERAKTVANEKTLQTINEWKKLFPNIDCSYEALDKSARIYLAGKEIFKEKDWSFAGIQCQPDMIDNYLAPCLPVAMWNEDGFIASCENDINNALGMYLARSITGKPSMFADIFHLDKKTKTVHVLNCGTAAPYIAGGPDNILLKDQTPLQGSWDEKSNCSLCKGGVCTQFIMPKGKVTIIRFGRINGKYVIHLSRAEALEHEYNPDELEGIASIWPFAYIKLQMEDIESFIGNMRSHHAVIVPEDCYESIQIFANLLKITLL